MADHVRSLGFLAIALGAQVACADPTDDDVLSSARVVTACEEGCVGPEGLDAPTFTLQDMQRVLGLYVPMYSQNPSLLFTGSWTNWHHEDMDKALAKLAVMRGILDRFNLWDSYLGPLPAIECPPDADQVRSIDGRCNDPANPLMGAKGIRFGRNVPPFLRDADGNVFKNPAAQVDPDLMSPNPREVSRRLFKRKQFQGVPFLNMFAAAWVQFQVHDWFDHGPSSRTEFFRVPLAEDDELRVKFGVSELVVPKTASDPSRTPIDNAMLPPTFQNAVTHWWDGSQLYGSDLETANRLRAFEGGRLRVDDRGLLPVKADGFEDTGMRENWWLGLALLHNLFSAEHNAIADMLAAAYPDWTDQQLYDKARMINAALIAKIHTLEWTPAILPNPTLEVGMNANWSGLNKFMDPPLPVPPRELRDPQSGPILFGVVGGKRDLKGVPFTLTEEFVSVYRMHPLLPDQLRIRSVETGQPVANYRTEETRNAGARAIEESHEMADLMYSFGVQHPGALVLQNYPKFIQELQLPFIGPFDMGTVDILRDRERGVPRYNEFRRQLRLRPLSKLEDLTSDRELLSHLRKLYGNDAGAIERVDLLVGTLAEAQRPHCYGFGETLFQVFTVMATRRLQADRFYTDLYGPEVYTPEGIAWIERESMKSVLLRHYPELAGTGLVDVANAFFPWQ